jgi:hypothetical protein
MPTKNMQSSNWAEVNLMRWVEGQMAPVGGQTQYSYSFASRCKAIHGWYDLSGVHYIAYLCETNLYVDIGGTLYDITPIGGMTAPIIPLTGGYSDGNYSDGTYAYGTPPPVSNIIPVDALPDAFSLANFGQVLLAMTSVDGRLLQWTPSAGTPGAGVILAATAAFTTTSTTITMVANPGSVLPGMGVYDVTNSQQIGVVSTYPNGGTTLTLTAPAMHASAGAADNLKFTSGAAVVAGAPYGRCFVVTPERFVMIFGMVRDSTTTGGSFRRFGWCDQENPYSWNFSSVTSQAGYLDIEPSSPIVTAVSTPLGVLFWTGTTTYISQFLGIPYVYNYQEIYKNSTPWSPASVVTTTMMTLWFSEQGLFSYNGSWVAPMACKVRPWIDDDIDPVNVREQACAVNVAPFNEFWWFFPQMGQPHNTRCVIYNYKEGWWSMGQMSRSAGITAAYTVQTIMADGLVAYQHELGNVYPGNVPLPWAETFDLNLASGSRLVTVKQLIPDIGGDVNNLLYSLFYRMSRSVAPDANGDPILVTEQQTPPRAVNTSNGFVDLRTTGRDIRMRIQLIGPEVNPVTVGQHLIDSVVRGDR